MDSIVSNDAESESVIRFDIPSRLEEILRLLGLRCRVIRVILEIGRCVRSPSDQDKQMVKSIDSDHGESESVIRFHISPRLTEVLRVLWFSF